ncbi:MAG: NAD-glutamate dehydrogenase [Micromonosporaceae bacterium]
MGLDHEKDAVLREAARLGADMPVAGVLVGAGAGTGAGAEPGPDRGYGPPAGPAAPEPDEILGFLRMYYRHVAPEDLAGRDPAHVAAVALEHAAFGSRRPQGRALVRVRTQRDRAESLAAEPTLIDIVTDDMPFLVDSVAMELGRHGLGIRVLIHPQLRVRRDVAGHLWEVCGRVDGHGGAGDEHSEAWIHIESGRTALPPHRLEEHLCRVLDNVRVAVEDGLRMVSLAVRLADRLDSEPPARGLGLLPPAERAEVSELLRWLADGHFTFLGCREYDLVEGPDGDALRALPGTGLGILRYDKQGSDSFAALPPEVRAKARERRLLILTKANSRATVYRPNYLDYVAVKKFDAHGEVVGEHRFLGLYSHAAYTESVTRIPVLRRKLAEVLERAAVPPDSHDGKDIAEILETYPREELFQISVDELLPIALGVLRLRGRRQTRLFLRKDVYGRYMSCLLYLPRDRYNTVVRLRAQEILRAALHGKTVDYSAMIGESVLARLHIVIWGERGVPLPEVNADELERALAAAARSWDDDLADEAEAQLGADQATRLMRVAGGAIPDGYKADVPAATAVADLMRVARLAETGGAFSVELYEPSGAAPGEQRLKVYRAESPIVLSDVLPELQHMGVEVVDERPYEFVVPSEGAVADAAAAAMEAVHAAGQAFAHDTVRLMEPGPPPGSAGAGSLPIPQRFWIYDFGLRRETVARAATPVAKSLFQDALTALWQGKVEDDGFNALVLDAGLSWRQVVVLRAYAKYLRQAGTAFSQGYIQRVLRSNPAIARLLVLLFESRFDPARQGRREAARREPDGGGTDSGGTDDGEAERSEAIAEEISGLLDEVASLDDDRILRSYLGLIKATLRTSYFQQDDSGKPKPQLAIKLDPGQAPYLPAPRPRFEVFVYSPRVEGVHLRFGRVARGGLRWSDRREDFRTEILGLVKAQQVKNAVIVPSGAKGGFVCKKLPPSSNREAWLAEGTACYKLFISGLLDVTDNLEGGRVVPPPAVVRHDGDDPYLVVAADKGTATFSDLANEVAAEYGFWLGDAFASGGSAGYDHKKMGITARGAWESVKHHFRALGIDTATQEFKVVGIGDMSGDVFGNGMVLSDRIKLVAAFDHRHVFVDPDPDPAASFEERSRLLRLPRSSWADYRPELISAGGGVWPRTMKSMPVSPQARAVLGLREQVTSLTPHELIRAILCAPVDLLWNGGIGTYVKATSESHADVGDRSNDAVRIDAPQVRARVVAEGGNLGLTQAARIEYALAGGLINTDFIDNSAGVDTSDHEVNIKILLNGAVREGRLTMAARDELLQEMTGEVASLVLRHNYQQNVCLAAARKQAAAMLHVHARYIRKLERDGLLRRRLEYLPADKVIAERRSAGLGLTGPEFATLLAYTKIALTDELVASGLPADEYLRREPCQYFPQPLRERYADRMTGHPLCKEIITTVVVNEMVDRSGTTFAFRLNEETGVSGPDLTRAWLVARQVFGMPGFWSSVEALDGQVDVATQISLLLEGRKLTERAARWLVLGRRPPLPIGATIDFFADGVVTIRSGLPKLLTGRDLAGFEERRDSFMGRGVPLELAELTAGMVPAYSTFDIVEIASNAGRSVDEVAEVYFDLAERLQITRIRERIIALPKDDRWNTMARAALRDDLYAAHAALTRDVLVVSGSGTPEERLAFWSERNESAVIRARHTLTEIWESERFTVATLSVALRAIRTLVTSSTLPQHAG